MCASADTLARYIQQKHSNRKPTINRCLNSDSFTLVSADNIDFMLEFLKVARIVAGTEHQFKLSNHLSNKVRDRLFNSTQMTDVLHQTKAWKLPML